MPRRGLVSYYCSFSRLIITPSSLCSAYTSICLPCSLFPSSFADPIILFESHLPVRNSSSPTLSTALKGRIKSSKLSLLVLFPSLWQILLSFWMIPFTNSLKILMLHFNHSQSQRIPSSSPGTSLALVSVTTYLLHMDESQTLYFLKLILVALLSYGSKLFLFQYPLLTASPVQTINITKLLEITHLLHYLY